MVYLGTFIEGVLAFISPCFLPLLPVYISFLFGDASSKNEKSTFKTFIKALTFVLGFSSVFIILGAVFATVGAFLTKYQVVINIITGIFVFLIGLNFIGVFNIDFSKNAGFKKSPNSLFKTFLFGGIFAISWTPCVSPFLGAALGMAMNSASTIEGVLMLLFFSLGLGIPLILSAFLIDELSGALEFLTKHSKKISVISGVFLCITGILMIFGILNYLIAALSIF